MTPAHRPLRIGLTGGIGSGKSTVADMLTALGAGLIDADQAARTITSPGGAALAPIAEAFGPHLIQPDGQLDRAALRERVFQDPEARRLLESITHPLVADHMAQALRESSAPVVVFDIPLLVESKRWRHRLDAILVVDCSAETQFTRVKARNGWPDDTIRAVLNAQASRLQRLQAADHCLCNDGIGIETLRHEVAIWAQCLPL